MPAGYSGRQLPDKLGLKSAHRVAVVNAPWPYTSVVHPLPPGLTMVSGRGRIDVAHVFVTRRADLARRLPGLRKRVAPEGAIWVSWPKRAAGVVTDVTEDVIREVAFANRMVDVKVCAVDDTWSGLRLVIRKVDR